MSAFSDGYLVYQYKVKWLAAINVSEISVKVADFIEHAAFSRSSVLEWISCVVDETVSPQQACLSVRSINEVICHGIPDQRKLQDGDIINSMLHYSNSSDHSMYRLVLFFSETFRLRCFKPVNSGVWFSVIVVFEHIIWLISGLNAMWILYFLTVLQLLGWCKLTITTAAVVVNDGSGCLLALLTNYELNSNPKTSFYLPAAHTVDNLR